jgi:hypothetical protein
MAGELYASHVTVFTAIPPSSLFRHKEMLAASKMKTQQKIYMQSGFKHGDNLYSRMYVVMNQAI